MGRATASVSFRTQVVLVYLQYISVKIHSKCALQPKIAKNSLKTHIFGVQGRSRSSMLVPLESLSAVLVMISSKSVSICNRLHARCRVTTCLENLEMSGNLKHVREMSGIMLTVREMSGKKSYQGKVSQNCSLVDEYLRSYEYLVAS